MRRVVAVVGLVCALASCKPAAAPTPTAPAILPTPVAGVPSAEDRSILVPSTAITTTGGGYLVPMAPSDLAAFYEATLPQGGWTISKAYSALPSDRAGDSRAYTLTICRQSDVWRAVILGAQDIPSVTLLFINLLPETKPCSDLT
jgi:hypothetical protein